ncbi:hypothetical protein [Lysobacter gummosus]|uniref:hypothetical protein n=1 Tax=Lysobacter gummosus TaxID=262324 RepID=UPI00363D2F5F
MNWAWALDMHNAAAARIVSAGKPARRPRCDINMSIPNGRRRPPMDALRHGINIGPRG